MIEELIINLLIFIVYLIIVLIIFMGSYVEEDTSVIPFHIKSSAFLLLQFVDYFGLQYNEDQSLALF